MIYILMFIIVCLCAAIVCLTIDFKKAKSRHELKIGELNYAIVQMMASNDSQLGQLKLSDELKEKLKTARETIDKDMLAMQYDFVETLSKNKLLD
ncbi:MAG TPA: hypothetical protein VK623_06285 [Flavobacterium sp.]|nr:hypothetical protein [Flavobacterium sp.]